MEHQRTKAFEASRGYRARWAERREKQGLRTRPRLVRAREQAGLTQAELAKALGITRLAVLNIEVGRRNPGFDLMRRWSAALGKDFNIWLV